LLSRAFASQIRLVDFKREDKSAADIWVLKRNDFKFTVYWCSAEVWPPEEQLISNWPVGTWLPLNTNIKWQLDVNVCLDAILNSNPSSVWLQKEWLEFLHSSIITFSTLQLKIVFSTTFYYLSCKQWVENAHCWTCESLL
jgi:hypothetical protein